MSKRDPDVLET